MGKENLREREADEILEPLILSVRSRRVIIDFDLADLYGVATKVLNQAVSRNLDRFPEDFAFRLSASESVGVRRPHGRTAPQAVESQRDIWNRSQAVTGSQKHRDRRFRPLAFTEHGALMAANVLRSRRAAQMSIYVIRAFVRLRERVAANASILKRLAEIDATLLQQDVALRDIYRKLLPLLQPPPDPPRRRIGFHIDSA
jgi:ORF6N domain-containing protein